MSDFAAHFGLFWISFLAATLLPGSSEAALVALVASFSASAITLFLTATSGNTAGAVFNWWLGRSLNRFTGQRWLPATASRLDQASRMVTRYGSWVLLFSWLPVVGDPLMIVAGALRMKFVPFLAFVAAGKAARYGVLLAGADLIARP
ncbi:MAG: YqaA family protein [Aestuariivirga sp.]